MRVLDRLLGHRFSASGARREVSRVFPMIRKRRKLGRTRQVVLGTTVHTSGNPGTGQRSSVRELEEVAFDADAVELVSDRRTLRVGGGHSEPDCEYIAGLVRAWIVELDLGN